ncbi:MAG: hypothetical protein CL669_05175 [Balneola sp.]|nr:hypothetical protein [Balneola sp.]
MQVNMVSVEKKRLNENEYDSIKGICSEYVLDVLDRLCVGRGLCLVDVKEYLYKLGYISDVSSSEKSCSLRGVDRGKKGKKCILPFCGSILNSCHGIKLNYGLYSQCMNDRDGNGRYCKTCEKQGKKNSTGKPNYGDITERMDVNWRDKKGKEAVRYANVMDKLEITREMAEKSASGWGIVIPELEFEIKEVKRGRPRKSVAVSDTESEASVEPKKRGRPRKEKSVISELSPGDDLIAGLIKEAKEKSETSEKNKGDKKNSEEVKSLESSAKEDSVMSRLNKDTERVSPEDRREDRDDEDQDDEEDDEDEQVEVSKWHHPKTGVEYYITDDNILYSMESEPVGRWNEDTGEIEKILDLEED